MSHVVHDLSDYGVIGIVTFVVNQSGKVHEQDLGDDTALKAAAFRSGFELATDEPIAIDPSCGSTETARGPPRGEGAAMSVMGQKATWVTSRVMSALCQELPSLLGRKVCTWRAAAGIGIAK